MNIHEHQAKDILKKFGAEVPNGEPIFSLDEIDEKFKKIKTDKVVLKAQIHAGGRGKAGGVKIVDNLEQLKEEAKNLLGKVLVTHQTGPQGREVKRLYIEEASDISKEFYLSCLVDRASSKIAFISSAEGGMDIEEVANKTPEKITTTRVSLSKGLTKEDITQVLKPYQLPSESIEQAEKLIQSIFKALLNTDANLIEVNPLILTKENQVLCLDAKINFDANALYRHPDILELRDFDEEDPAEIEASKYDLAYIKLDGEIGCMVNGAGLAMATMDLIKQAGGEPANFLDVGGTADAERVEAAFNLILKDPAVKAILVNIFGGIVRCDRVAQGIVDAYRNMGTIKVPIIVRLQGTNADIAKELIDNSGLDVQSAIEFQEAADKVQAVLG